MSLATLLPAWVSPRLRELLLDFQTHEGAEIVVMPTTQAVRIWPRSNRHVISWCRALKARSARVKLDTRRFQLCYFLDPPAPNSTVRSPWPPPHSSR